MTDTITPAPTADEYRAAERVLRAARFGEFRGGYDDEADWCKEEAARLEAESARDEYVETLADVLAVAEGGAHLDQLQGWRQTGLRAGVRAVLDRLAADGRLLPEGGTALTAEHWADVQLSVRDAVERALGRALTPPAASVPDSGPRTWDHLEKVPHDVVVTGGPKGNPAKWMEDANGWYGADWRWELNGTPVPIIHWSGTWTAVVPDSGPDGTPEKPWLTTDEIPTDVEKARDRDGDVWTRVGENWSCNCECCPVAPVDMNQHAPFVRVDGDKA